MSYARFTCTFNLSLSGARRSHALANVEPTAYRAAKRASSWVKLIHTLLPGCTCWYLLPGMFCLVCSAWYVLPGMFCLVCSAWSRTLVTVRSRPRRASRRRSNFGNEDIIVPVFLSRLPASRVTR